MCKRQRAKNGRKFLESLRESFSEKMCVCVLHKSRASDLEQRESERESRMGKHPRRHAILREVQLGCTVWRTRDARGGSIVQSAWESDGFRSSNRVT